MIDWCEFLGLCATLFSSSIQRGFRRCVFFFPCFDLLAVEMKLVLNDPKHPLRANSAMALSHFLERKFHCAELNVCITAHDSYTRASRETRAVTR